MLAEIKALRKAIVGGGRTEICLNVDVFTSFSTAPNEAERLKLNYHVTFRKEHFGLT